MKWSHFDSSIETSLDSALFSLVQALGSTLVFFDDVLSFLLHLLELESSLDPRVLICLLSLSCKSLVLKDISLYVSLNLFVHLDCILLSLSTHFSLLILASGFTISKFRCLSFVSGITFDSCSFEGAELDLLGNLGLLGRLRLGGLGGLLVGSLLLLSDDLRDGYDRLEVVEVIDSGLDFSLLAFLKLLKLRAGEVLLAHGSLGSLLLG